MDVKNLNREELVELKERYYTGLLDRKGESPSYGELAAIDDLVDDDTIFEVYAGVDFVEDDFFCSCGVSG